MTAVKHEPISLLNASYEILSINFPLHRAVRLLHLHKAIVEESVPDQFLGPFPFPRVLRLVQMVKVARKLMYGPPRVSKRGVLLRDKHECAYDSCKRYASTIDHVMPRSRGGTNFWENLVAACSKCNHRKGNRTPEEAGMKLKWMPYVPTRAQLFTK